MKPDEPNEFLLNELRRIQQMKANNEPITLFNEADLINMFSIFDITGRGYITQLQYARGMTHNSLVSSTILIFSSIPCFLPPLTLQHWKRLVEIQHQQNILQVAMVLIKSHLLNICKFFFFLSIM